MNTHLKNRILVAEDDLVSQKLIATLLSPYGEVVCVSDGSEAITALRFALTEGRPFQLVCLDVMMPHTDGIEVLQTLRAIESEHGIDEDAQACAIMLTAVDSKDVFLKSFQGGSQWFVTKPIKREELLGVLAELGFEVSAP